MDFLTINNIQQIFKILGKAAVTGIMYGLVAKVWRMNSATKDNIQQTPKILGKAAFTGIIYGLVVRVWRLE